MTDPLAQLRRRYTIRTLPADMKRAFEKRLRLHEDWGQRTFVRCPTCLNGYSRSAQFSTCIRCCPHITTITGYLRASNGVCKGQRVCLACGLRRDLRRGEVEEIFDLCLRDNVSPHPCERCGARDGTEEQHWAPQAIFGDADQWPKSWLCPRCHRVWHDAMRDARGVSLPRERRARVPGLNPRQAGEAWGSAS